MLLVGLPFFAQSLGRVRLLADLYAVLALVSCSSMRGMRDLCVVYWKTKRKTVGTDKVKAYKKDFDRPSN